MVINYDANFSSTLPVMRSVAEITADVDLWRSGRATDATKSQITSIELLIGRATICTAADGTNRLPINSGRPGRGPSQHRVSLRSGVGSQKAVESAQIALEFFAGSHDTIGLAQALHTQAIATLKSGDPAAAVSAARTQGHPLGSDFTNVMYLSFYRARQ